MTEAAAFSSAAQKDSFTELGVEQYKIVASFDKDTCEICGAMDGQVFKMTDYQIGLTAPPFHPWCRCCTAPYFEDMEGLGERWTRNEDGTAEKVPADMSFEEWRERFVKNDKDGLTAGIVKGIIRINNSELKNGLPLIGTPGSIVDKVDDSGKVLQRRVYGADGKALMDFDTTDHGQPQNHPTGAHKHVFDYSRRNMRGKPCPFTEEELIGNNDIIKKGENYHDPK